MFGRLVVLASCSACVGSVCLGAGAASQPAPADPAAVQRLDRAWGRIEPVRPGMGSRSLFDFALEAAAAGYRPDRIARALVLAEQMQDRDRSSRTFGNFRWYWRAARCEDLNAVEFCMQKGVLAWMHYRDRLGAEGRERLQRLMSHGVEGIRRHRVREAYTNIFLMKAWNCIALGESTGRKDLAAEGCAMLDRWLMYTWEAGIHEYGSPTYYGVDLESLGLIARHARDAQARRGAEAALRLFWTDIAANWFAPCQRLGGAHSRDYDYLTGRGHLDRQLRQVGWLPTDRPYAPSAFERLCAWAPPAEIRALSRRVPRRVRQRWGGGAGQTAAHYVGRSFSIGSAGANYGPMDKVLTVDLAGGPRMPVVNFVMDARGDPYGKKRLLTGGGHSKAFHVTPLVASVQRAAEVLLLASADPNAPRFRRYAPQPTCLLSHLVIPAAADVWLGDRPVKLDPGGRLDVPAGRAVFLRFRGAAVGLRFVLALDTGGRPAPVEIVRDGDRYGALRLTCTHSSQPPRGRATVAVWAAAREGLDEGGFAEFRRRLSAAAAARGDRDRVEVAVAGLERRLRLAVNLRTGERLAVEGGDADGGDFLLAVDGRDLGRECLADVPVIARYLRALAAAVSGAAGAARAGEVFEAESAAFLSPPFRVGADDEASGGRFVWMPGPDGGKGGSPVARAVWCVAVPEAGAYRLWARVRAPTPSDDSFFVAVRQGRRAVVPRADWHTGVHAKWSWAPVCLGPGRAPLAARLAKGPAVLELFCREDGTRIDALCLTKRRDWRPPGADQR